MATIEERLTRLENDNAELKKAIDLHTIMLRALVNGASLEELNECGKPLEALMYRNRFSNVTLAEIMDQLTRLDDK